MAEDKDNLTKKNVLSERRSRPMHAGGKIFP